MDEIKSVIQGSKRIDSIFYRRLWSDQIYLIGSAT